MTTPTYPPSDPILSKGQIAVGTATSTKVALPPGVDGAFLRADSTQAAGMGYGTFSGVGMDGLALAPNPLTDTNITINPGTDKASRYEMPASANMTANRTITLGTAGSPITGQTVWIIRRDLSAYTLSIGALVTLPASPAKPMGACIQWNGASWELLGVCYLTVQ